MRRQYPSPTIRFVDMEGLIVILDLSRAEYFILNETASAAWRSMVSSNDSGAGAAPLASSGDIDEESFQRAVSDFAGMGFLSVSPPQPEPRPAPEKQFRRPRLLSLLAWWHLCRATYLLRTRGFSRTYRLYAGTRFPLAAETISIADGRAAFLRSESWFFFSRNAPLDCVPRSLALFSFLRRAGLNVSHRVGGRRFPVFNMHAWVEHAGVPVLDDPRYARDYHVITSIDP
jgi:hypothetical protein